MKKEFLFLFVLACSCQQQAESKLVVDDLGWFEYDGNVCTIKSVHWNDSPRHYSIMHFIDCGNGPISGQYIDGKRGLK